MHAYMHIFYDAYVCLHIYECIVLLSCVYVFLKQVTFPFVVFDPVYSPTYYVFSPFTFGPKCYRHIMNDRSDYRTICCV